MGVYVVTCPKMGWDCFIGVYSMKVSLIELKEEFPSPEYVINSSNIEEEILS